MNCDPLARWYRWLEYAGFGRALERRRMAFLSGLVDARKVLMLGEGDGRFLAAFLRLNSVAQVDYVDSSGKMLALARSRALATDEGGKDRVRFHHAEVGEWLGSGTSGDYDVVCTHFFLDCFTTEQLGMLIPEIRRHAPAPARWVISEFHYPSGRFAGWAARLFVAILYRFFRWSTDLRIEQLPDYGAAMQNAGFRLINRRSALGELLISECWERG